ncbi:MAG: hypothetical protein KGI42_03305 [Xanthomonadaceae bacterium]|nr:hypothetical protein [Xanthomonadaceae bacterium]
MQSTKPSFRFSSEALSAARVAAEREGLALAEFVRRAVEARVAGTTSTTGPSLSTTAQLQAATAALMAAAENTERLKTQVDRINTVGRQFAEIAQRMAEMQS